MQVSVVLSDNKFHVQCNIIKVTGNTDVKHFGNKQPLFLLIYITLFTNNQYNLVFLVETTSLAYYSIKDSHIKLSSNQRTKFFFILHQNIFIAVFPKFLAEFEF